MTRTVFVSALDSAGAPVLNLTADDFQVTESGVKREVTRAALGNAPMRIVLMVDSSTPVAPMINNFRTALNAFVDELPEVEEVVFISSGGQIRVRTPAERRSRQAARARSRGLRQKAAPTRSSIRMLEADKRFLKTAPGQWPAFVFVTTDNGDGTREPNVDDYNKFMNDFLARGGVAHAVIVQGKRTGSITDIVANLVDNTGGVRHTIVTDHSLPERLREIADRLADDHQRMMTRYEVTFSGDAKAIEPVVNITVSRDDVQLQMSVRRPF